MQLDRLSVAISPCPNDTFSFYHFLNDPGHDEKYIPEFFDIEELNKGMLGNKWDIVKASFPAALDASENYELLNSGSAIGFGVGPIVVYSSSSALSKSEWNLGLPGVNTTANFLWKFFVKNSSSKLPAKINLHYLNFADVMKKTASGELDAGVVIHEGRFVYRELGLELFQDLGEFWQNTTTYPVPLGGIFIKKKLSGEIKSAVESDLNKSIALGLSEKKNGSSVYFDSIIPFIQSHSQEMDTDVIEKHIEYYVNEDTVLLSEKSREAISYFNRMIKEIV